MESLFNSSARFFLTRGWVSHVSVLNTHCSFMSHTSSGHRSNIPDGPNAPISPCSPTRSELGNLYI